MKNLGGFLRYWLPIAVAVSFGCMAVYVVEQQNFRQNANDPQVQLARDAAVALAQGASASELAGEDVDMAVSLAPFVNVYDKDGKVVDGHGLLGGKIATPPKGVLEAAVVTGEDRVTWQPRPDVRIASVVVPIGDGSKGTVLAGRSLSEVEARIDTLGKQMLLAWVGTLIATAVAAIVIGSGKPRGA